MKEIILLVIIIISFPFSSHAKDISLEDLYEKFNMRSIFSSYGQRLKYYCESYPIDYFPENSKTLLSDNQMQLRVGDDLWIFKIIGPNQISIFNAITSGTYESYSEYKIEYNEFAKDWRAHETFIDVPSNCVSYQHKNF